jgi:hypothetical protein
LRAAAPIRKISRRVSFDGGSIPLVAGPFEIALLGLLFYGVPLVVLGYVLWLLQSIAKDLSALRRLAEQQAERKSVSGRL